AGFISGFLLSYILKKPQFEPEYKYDWQHPDYDERSDDFIKQFDANGNYNPLPLLRKDTNGYIYNETFHRKNNSNHHSFHIVANGFEGNPSNQSLYINILPFLE